MESTTESPKPRPETNAAFVARQAIFDRRQTVVGYELLFRRAPDDQVAVIDDRDKASTRLILDTFLDLGLERIVGDCPAFLNLTRNFFLGSQTVPFPKDRVVLELLEDQEVDAPLIEAVRAYAEQGYRIALDDFEFDESYVPLLEIADIVKLDVLALSPSQIERQLRLLAPYDLVRLAEKVETPEHFEFCRDLGFDLYQGYFLCRPNVVQGQRVPANRLATLRLLAKLQDPRVEIESLEKIIREDLSLSYKLLKLINSAFYALPQKVESIRQTLVLLGVRHIRSWVSLLALSQLEDKPDELMVTAMVRARMCERLAEAGRLAEPEVAFTVGLFSTLDALLDMPMEDVLDSLPLVDSIRDSLLGHSGPLGAALDCVLAYERGQWDDVAFRDLTPADIRDCYLDAIEWAHATAHELGI